MVVKRDKAAVDKEICIPNEPCFVLEHEKGKKTRERLVQTLIFSFQSTKLLVKPSGLRFDHNTFCPSHFLFRTEETLLRGVLLNFLRHVGARAV